jgi:CHAT domain-containing protein/tetratricopeptide (TPR) repeat protein
LCPLALLLLIPLRDNDADGAQTAYEHALRLFQQRRLGAANSEAAAGWQRYREKDPEWAGQFQLLYARTLLYNGQYGDLLKVLAEDPDPHSPDREIQRLAMEASSLTQLGQLKMAEQRLDEAEAICAKAQYVSCSAVMTSRASLAQQLGQMDQWQPLYLRAYAYARDHRDTWRQVNYALILGHTALQSDHSDEAIEWSRICYQVSMKNGYDDMAQAAAGNEGWAWYQLGDHDRALEQFEAAEKVAAGLEDFDDEQIWLSTESYVYRDRGEMQHAAELDRRALQLSQQIGDKEAILNAKEDMAHLAIYAGKIQEADARMKEILPMETAGGRKPHPEFPLMEAELASARHEYAQAEEKFHAVLSDTASPMLVRLTAGDELGRLYEYERKYAAAERMYKATIVAWDAARGQLKHEESQLSFGTNAGEIYRNYVRFLVKRGRTAEALAIADQSRARTLAEGLRVSQKHAALASEALHPEQIARKRGATLLFYWLGDKESYLWAIMPEKTAFTKLPAEKGIAARVARYNKAIQNQAIQDVRDPAETANADGLALYAALIAPARSAMRARRPVIVLTDGALSELNFETLLVPGAAGEKAHYLVEDNTLLSAPSLDLLAHGEADKGDVAAKSLLLIGNPAAADVDFPPLPLFGMEMTRVAGHFSAGDEKVFAGALATPVAYEAADPGKYAYIHFVSHATASRTSPLDSAIILSNPAAPGSGVASDQGSPVSAYKLYAREIVAHPLEARLVTISACYGSGTRAYTGEGLVGLSWAFLRAGARQVVAALWEVTDDSTPRLMDALYKGIADGEKPAEALREAKLAMLHSGTKFEQPFYWAPFQIYSRE